MATRIYNTDTFETIELSVITDGQDFLAEVIGGCDCKGEWASAEMPDDANFAMSGEELDWWERWSVREQAILDRVEELGDDAQQMVARLAADYGYDMDLLQGKEEEYLGISE